MITFAEGKKLATTIFVVGSFDDIPISTIIGMLIAADNAYFNDEDTFLEDSQYDALKQYAQQTSPADPYFTGVGSAVRGGKVALPHKMGSLNQVYPGDYVKWVASNRIATEQVVLSDKLDGASTLLVYDAPGSFQIGYSRGDGFEGADISRHLRQMGIPSKIANATGKSVAIRAENIITPASFTTANTGKLSRGGRIYKNPRNMVSGLMNSSENNPQIYQYIDTVTYEIVGSSLPKSEQLKQLQEWGFRVVKYSLHKAGDLNDEKLTEILVARRAASIYELDGVVLDIDSDVVRARLATDELNPEYAVKYKVADSSNYAIATVKGVEWNLSKDGYYKPRVQIEPVDLVGVTIQNFTGFNAKFIKDNGIGPGAKISVTRSGDVIPFICGCVEPVDPQMPDDPDAEWTETGVDLILADVANNETVKFERLTNFFSSLDVAHLGDGNLMKIFEMGFDVPEKIIPLAHDDIGNLVGSSSIGKKIHASLRERLTDIFWYQLAGAHHAFGRGVGVRKMKKLWDAFKGDITQLQNFGAVIAVEGFDKKTATKIAAGYEPFMQFVELVKPYVTFKPYEAPKEGVLSGMTLVFTGFRSSEMEKQVVEAGGKMGSTVSSKTTYLVTAEPDSTSGKAKKAREIGVKVVGLDELKAMLK